MVSINHQARYVLLDQASSRVMAIYRSGVPRRDIEPLMGRINALVGVRAGVMRGSVDDPHALPVTVAWLGVKGARPEMRERAKVMFKELTRPLQPIGIARLRIEMLICKCSYLSSRTTHLTYVDGFEPEDDESFRLRYYARMKMLRLGALMSQQPQPPYGPVANALEAMLGRLGAHVTMLDLKPLPDPRPCRHTD